MLPLQRLNSRTIGKQDKGTGNCFAWVTARMATKFVKNLSIAYFPPDNIEACNYYYTSKCMLDPFPCFDKTKNKVERTGCLHWLGPNRCKSTSDFYDEWPECKGNSETTDAYGYLKENLTAALHSYFYINITNKFGCNGGKTYDVIQYIAKELFYAETTIESVAQTLTQYRVVDPLDKVKKPLIDSYVLHISEIINDVLKRIRESLTSKKLQISSYAYYIKEVNEATDARKNNFMLQLKKCLNFGYYASISLKLYENDPNHHVKVIINEEDVFDGENLVDINLSIKNSWGANNKSIMYGITPVNGVYTFSFNFLMSKGAYIIFIMPKVIDSEGNYKKITHSCVTDADCSALDGGRCNTALGFCELNTMGGKKVKSRKRGGVRAGTRKGKGVGNEKVTGGRKGKRKSGARRVTRRIRE